MPAQDNNGIDWSTLHDRLSIDALRTILKTQAEVAKAHAHAQPRAPSGPPKKNPPKDTGRRHIVVVMGRRGTQFADGILNWSDVHFELVQGARLALPRPPSATLADICVPTSQPTCSL